MDLWYADVVRLEFRRLQGNHLEQSLVQPDPKQIPHILLLYTIGSAGNYAEFRIRIGSGFNPVIGSVSGSVFGSRIKIQESKYGPQKKKKINKYNV
jgi:hypothetical protein